MIDVTGQRTRFLTRLAVNAGDLKPALERITDEFLDDERQHFATSGSGRWQPLAPAYLRWRVRTGRGTKPMRYATGRGGLIEKSLTRRGAKFQEHYVSNDRMKLVTTSAIAARQHTGFGRTVVYPNGKRKRFVIPPRSLTNVSAQTRRNYAAIMQDHLTGS